MSDEEKKSWIYAGGLPYELTEGDIVCVFSQYGEILEISLSRDKETGKSRGFCFIKYEDHRSCELAVDNLNAATVVGRRIKVSHANNVNAVKARRPAIVPNQEQTNNASLLPQIEDGRDRLKRKQDRSPSDHRDRYTRRPDRSDRESKHRDDYLGDRNSRYRSEQQIQIQDDRNRSPFSSSHREHHRDQRRDSQERPRDLKKSSSHHDSERKERDRIKDREGKHRVKESQHRDRSGDRNHRDRSRSRERRHRDQSRSRERGHRDRSGSRERRHRDRSVSRERRHYDTRDHRTERVPSKYRDSNDNRPRNSERNHRYSERRDR